MYNIEVSEEQVNSFRRNKRTKDECTQSEDDSGKMMDIMDQDINRLRIENIKLEQALKQAQDKLALQAVNQNNTSSTFMLPSEFKAKWEQMVKENLPNAFLTLCDYPQMLVYAVQSSCLYVQRKLENLIKLKTQQIASILGLNDQNNNLEQQLIKIFQDNYQNVLAFNEHQIDDFQTTIQEQLTYCVRNYCIGDVKEMRQSKDDWMEQIKNDDMIEWFKIFWALMSYILLSNSQLSLGFQSVEFNFQEFKKNDFYCVDGFGKEGSPSMIVLPPVMRQTSHIYHGLKSAVLILTSDFKNLQQSLAERPQSIPEIILSDQKLTLEDLAVPQMITDNKDKITPQINDSDYHQNDDNEETRPFQSQRQQQIILNSIQQDEFRIKPQKYSKKSQDEQMKDTLEFINKLQQQQQKQSIQNQSFEANKKLDQSLQSKESERFYMPKHLRTQNSRIENNSSFLGKISANNTLAGKIVHQKSIHFDNQSIISSQPITNSSRIYQNTRSKIHDKENQNKGLSIAQLIQRISKVDTQPTEKINSLDKLMKSFCQSQRGQGLKQSQVHQRAQSNENNSRTYQNLLQNFSSDDEEEDRKKILKPRTKQIISQNVKRHQNIKTSQFLQKYKQLDFKVL